MRSFAIGRTAGIRIGGVAFAGLLFALPCAADMTVTARYQLANGDSLVRATYYTKERFRGTSSDGNELIYDARTKEVTFLNHAKKRYWKGPLDRANAIVDSLTMERDKTFWEAAQAKQQEWMSFTEQFNNSLTSRQAPAERKIVGKKCMGWELSAGKSMTHTRWYAPDVELPDYTPQMEKLLILPILDPVGRSIVRLILQGRKFEGLTLAASTTFKTPTQEGRFSWEATRLDAAKIPDTVWEVPKDYERITF